MVKKTDVVFSERDLSRLQSIGQQIENTVAGEQLLDKLDNAIAVDNNHKSLKSVVKIGDVVEYKTVGNDDIRKVELVFPVDANIDQNKISVTSLLAVSLMGHKIGAVVDMLSNNSNKKSKIEILSISEIA